MRGSSCSRYGDLHPSNGEPVSIENSKDRSGEVSVPRGSSESGLRQGFGDEVEGTHPGRHVVDRCHDHELVGRE